MAIDFSNMLMKLSPVSAIDLGGLQQGMQMGQERQRLALARQQFEESKRQNQENERLRRISEQGEMRRAEMQMERAEAERAAQLAQQKQQQQAALAAKQREHAEAAYGDVFKARGELDYAGMSAAAERLRQHGGLAEDMGVDEQGRPSYRLGVSAEEYQQQQGQRDAQSAEQPGEESLPQSLNRLNALGYDTTTEGVVDTGALQDQTMRQLRPALDSYRQSFPSSHQGSVGHSNDAAAALAGNPAQGLKLAQELGTAPQAALAKELDAERDMTKEERLAKRALSKEERDAERAAETAGHGYAKQGRADAAGLWKTNGLEKAQEKRKAADQVMELLGNDNHLDDSQVAHLFTNLKGSIGPQSDKEIAAVFGTEDMSLAEWGLAKFRNWWGGGQDKAVKDALIGIVKRSVEMDDDKVRSYLDSAARTLASPETSPEAKRGWRQFLDTVDPAYRKAHSEYRKEGNEPTLEELAEERKQEAAGATATPIRFNMEEDAAEHGALPPPGEFDTELQRQASEAGLDAASIKGVIGPESGNNPNAVNARSGATGLIQFLPSVAKSLGTSAEELATMSAIDQIPYVIKYLKRSGLTAEHDQSDYYVGLAAPAFVGKPDDTVVYKKGSKAWEDNPLWRPKDGGDITVGDIKAYGGGMRTEAPDVGDRMAVKPPATGDRMAVKPGKHDDWKLLE